MDICLLFVKWLFWVPSTSIPSVLSMAPGQTELLLQTSRQASTRQKIWPTSTRPHRIKSRAERCGDFSTGWYSPSHTHDHLAQHAAQTKNSSRTVSRLTHVTFSGQYRTRRCSGCMRWPGMICTISIHVFSDINQQTSTYNPGLCPWTPPHDMSRLTSPADSNTVLISRVYGKLIVASVAKGKWKGQRRVLASNYCILPLSPVQRHARAGDGVSHSWGFPSRDADAVEKTKSQRLRQAGKTTEEIDIIEVENPRFDSPGGCIRISQLWDAANAE